MTEPKKEKPEVTKSFVRVFAFTFAGMLFFLCGVIWLFNPFNNMPLRELHTTQNYYDVEQRFFYPAIARQPQYDSAVFGTSVIRALRTDDMGRIFGGTFAQLALNNGSAYEQHRLFNHFMRFHPGPHAIIQAVDVQWCQRGTSYTITERSYPFPEYLYDDNRWNDVPYLFNTKMLEIIGRMVNYNVRGKGRVRHHADGWGYMWPHDRQWNITDARKEIYGTRDGSAIPVKKQVPPFKTSAEERAKWTYATHEMLRKQLETLPKRTAKILIFPPYHIYKQGAEGSENRAVFDECKKRVVSMARYSKNILVLDFMVDSPFTRNDKNYWDNLHYTEEATKVMTDAIEQAAHNPLELSDIYRVLYADWKKMHEIEEYP